MATVWIQMQPAYILHRRPFRETSLLLEVFSKNYGRVSLIARGIRASNSRKSSVSRRNYGRSQELLQPFVPLLLSWRGRTELLNVVAVEFDQASPGLEGQRLFCAWYMNELLMRTLGHGDACPALFEQYQASLYGLLKNPQSSLRQFEKHLLTTLGVMPTLDREHYSGQAIQPQYWYTFSPHQGVLSQALTSQDAHQSTRFLGEVLIAIQNNQWDCRQHWPAMKRLFGLMLDQVLVHQVICSRDLLI